LFNKIDIPKILQNLAFRSILGISKKVADLVFNFQPGIRNFKMHILKFLGNI
tara:strand:+ start:622 stop:777 length:156 start_codon:yes stop_codon:yes gene_type:complete